MDATDKAEPIQKADPKEPIEPTEQAEPIEPIEPIESTEPFDAIERNESSDQSDHFDVFDCACALTRRIVVPARVTRSRRATTDARHLRPLPAPHCGASALARRRSLSGIEPSGSLSGDRGGMVDSL
jgi:hypothetical protein